VMQLTSTRNLRSSSLKEEFTLITEAFRPTPVTSGLSDGCACKATMGSQALQWTGTSSRSSSRLLRGSSVDVPDVIAVPAIRVALRCMWRYDGLAATNSPSTQQVGGDACEHAGNSQD
jgi:hypothetical protein